MTTWCSLSHSGHTFILKPVGLNQEMLMYSQVSCHSVLCIVACYLEWYHTGFQFLVSIANKLSHYSIDEYACAPPISSEGH